MNGSRDIEPTSSNANPSPLMNKSPLASIYHDGGVNLKTWSLDSLYLEPVVTREEQRGLDLADSIHGLYRLIDLITEQGSGGLVDKMVISPHIRGLVNKLSPGAFHGLTKIDLDALDNVVIKPIGIYGSKQEITRYLKSKGAINDEVENLLLESQDTHGDVSRPVLRPGIYAFMQPPEVENGHTSTMERTDSGFVSVVMSNRHGQNTERSTPSNPDIQRVSLIFWPEETSWNDDAKGPVRRNRTTFMRYLTKATEQIVLMASDEHIEKFVWNSSGADEKDDIEKVVAENDEDGLSDEEGDARRIFSFEVSQSEDVEKRITVRDGFTVRHPAIKYNQQRHISINTKPGQLDTRLVTGDTVQAVMTVRLAPGSVKTEKLDRECTKQELDAILTASSTSLQLSPNISRSSIYHLFVSGTLGAQYPDVVAAWNARVRRVEAGLENDKQVAKTKIESGLRSQEAMLKKVVEDLVVEEIVKTYPTLDTERLRVIPPVDVAETTPEDFRKGLFHRHKDIPTIIRRGLEREDFTSIQDKTFLHLKSAVLASKQLLSRLNISDLGERLKLVEHIKAQEYEEAISMIDAYDPVQETCDPLKKAFFRLGSCTGGPIVRGSLKQAMEDAQNVTNHQFVGQLDTISMEYPVLARTAVEARSALYAPLTRRISSLVDSLAVRLSQTQALDVSCDLMKVLVAKREEMLDYAHKVFLDELASLYTNETSENTLVIDNLVCTDTGDQNMEGLYTRGSRYRIKGTLTSRRDYRLRHTLLPLKLSEIDQHEMKINPLHIPKPVLKDDARIEFPLPLGHEILLIRLLNQNRCLLIVEADSGDISIYVEDLSMLNHALQERKHKKSFPKTSIGNDVACTYNETSRRIVLCSRTFPENNAIHSFVIDEAFATLKTQDVLTKHVTADIRSLVCIPGRDVVAPVRNGVSDTLDFFDFGEQQDCTHKQSVGAELVDVFSSPNGKMLIVVKQECNEFVLESLTLSLDETVDTMEIARVPSSARLPNMQVSSVNGKDNVYLLVLDREEGSLRSFSIGHADLSSNYYFKEMQERQKLLLQAQQSHHNSLLDCHYDVWTRFPLTPAIQREALTTVPREQPKLFGFVSNSSGSELEIYFKDLLDHFQVNTTKSSVQDIGEFTHFILTFASYMDYERSGALWQRVAAYKAGQWLANVFCLVPIHVAIAHNNQFIPIKDGVWDPAGSARMVGKKLEQVVDSLSFGWYESLFQSYHSQKAVKVVSSMGEQSVGKSFALNHFVDSTFAGSAMRTTEGVWMSVTPTPKYLVVALDFEGVHSLERTPTEDTLLVLFNAAISNLILFRNNYALSRDITGLLQSFQSSSTILKPEENPSLFKSKLMFIIKDVVDYDRDEIAREFQLKLQAIVQREQASNFITKLHRGNVDIVTWPVIESPDFYLMFKNLNSHLTGMQGHDTANNFIRVMKMLMGKLKLHDWSSMTSNMTSYKIKYLLSTLPNALAFGATEIEPQVEPLKNIDMNDPIKCDDSQSIFWVKSLGAKHNKRSQEDTFQALCKSWPKFSERSTLFQDETTWSDGLADYIKAQLDARISHVEAWVNENLQNCNQEAEEVRSLKSVLSTELQQITLSHKLCRKRCNDCELMCIEILPHDGLHSCGTGHKCAMMCEFSNVHPGENRACTLRAGHTDKHVCDPKIHVCGQRCSMETKYGCKMICGKEIGHKDKEHVCSAPQHMCGKHCDLQSANTHGKRKYNCDRLCVRPWNELHDTHTCERRQTCPIQCKLCQNTCSTTDHLHGLLPNAYHLCDQEHQCEELCESDGTCRIDKAENAISMTSKRQLPCAVPIPIGRLKHEGKHVHGLEEDLFHFCAHRCMCLEYCTLPYGHSQKEHAIVHSKVCIRKKWVPNSKT